MEAKRYEQWQKNRRKEKFFGYLKTGIITAAVVASASADILYEYKVHPDNPKITVEQMCYKDNTPNEAYQLGELKIDGVLGILRGSPPDTLPDTWRPKNAKCITVFDLMRVKEEGERNELSKLRENGTISIRK